MIVMDVEKTIENAWFKTVEDFKNAQRSGEAWLWTEATLRLNFLRHLSESAKLGRVIAETPYHLGDVEYKPDIVADIIINDDIKRVVFEMKFLRQTKNWKKDLKKLEGYGLVGWDYGYFLAIGHPQQCKEVQKDPLEEYPYYRLRVLTHSIPQIITIPAFKFAEYVLKKSLGKDVPYVVNELYGAVALYEKYALFFDLSAKEDKFVVWAQFLDKPPEEQKIKELGYAWITFDERGKMRSSGTFTGRILIGEFERAIAKVMAQNVKEPLNRFKEKIEHLYKT